MKVLCLIDNLGSGGAQRQIVTLAKLFIDKGLEVSFLTYSKNDFFADVLIKEGINIHLSEAGSYFTRIFKIRKYIRLGGFDVVISFLDTPNFLNCFAALGGRSWKIITSERSSREKNFLTRRGKIFGWFQRFSDAIVCNSDNAKQMWLNNYPGYANKLTTIYNSVLLPKITSIYEPKREGKVHIVVAASYQYLKNPIGVVKAAVLLNEEERKKIHIDWYGNNHVSGYANEAYSKALALIKENNLETVISLNISTKEIANIMNSADIIGLFSELEGLPNAICEGMMIGKPIIMSRVSDYTNLVDETNGFLCDWDNSESIKEAFINALNLTPKELQMMGANSKNKALQMFSEDKIVLQWIKIIS